MGVVLTRASTRVGLFVLWHDSQSQCGQTASEPAEDSVRSTMQERPLTVASILRHGAAVFADSTVVTVGDGGSRRASFGEVAERSARLANALKAAGVSGDQRVGTFQWNNQEHLEAYLAV